MAKTNNSPAAGQIGCCGAYCKTCRAFKDCSCKGCKWGYEEGKRNINDAKCRMKVCCIKRNLETCADCVDYGSCGILKNFYGKNGYKYAKYKQATEFIRKNGYVKFLETAKSWKSAYGKLAP